MEYILGLFSLFRIETVVDCNFRVVVFVYWHCPHSMRSRIYETVQCPSVCLSHHGPPVAGDID